jgi:hypothetical protein
VSYYQEERVTAVFLLASQRSSPGAATKAKENNMTSNTTPALWRRITVSAVGAGAIAIGAMAMSAPANAETFEHSCTTNPGAYATGATIGAYHIERRGVDRDQVCKVYTAAYKLLGTTTHTDYGWYSVPKHLYEQQLPVEASQVR